MLLAVLCVVGLIPANSASAAEDNITLKEFGYAGVAYQSAKLGRCDMHQMYFDHAGQTITGFCADHGAGMGFGLVGQKWSNPVPITDPTVKVFVAFYYSNVERVYTDKAKAMGLEANWSSYVTWYMNAIVQAIIWRYKDGTLTNPVEDCAEEMMYVYNNILGEHYTSIDQEYEGTSFRDFIQTILDEGIEVWGDWSVYQYTHTGPGTSYHPAGTVQGIIIATPSEEVTHDTYTLIIRKVDAADPDKGLPGAHFNVQSDNGSFMKDVFTGVDGTCALENLNPGTYAVTEVDAPSGYTIDDPGPQYVVLPDGENNTVTVTFTDSKDPENPPPVPASGSIRKVDADNPTVGLAGSVIKVEGVDNSFVGTYTTDEEGYLSDMPWDTLEKGCYVATEVTPPEGYSLSPDPNKVKQTFEWDGEHDVALVFENDAKVKVQLKKQDESGNPIAGVVFNIFCDGELIGSEATDTQGTITVAAVTEGLYAFVEVAPAAGYNKLTWPVVAHVDQADIQGGGTVTVTAVNNQLPGLRIVKIDSKTGEGIPGVTFRVWRDTTFIDDLITGANGEINLDDLQPGTYVVQEVSSDDSHVLDGTPQQVELVAGEGVKQLVFVNDPKPGMHLVKLDSETMKPLAGAKFRISKVGGDFSKEYTTDVSGSIDLSNLDPGAYEVVEISAPDEYLIDEARRVIELVAGEDAEFVFTDTKRPTLVVEKLDAHDGKPLAGATFRIGKIDDPDHYVDKVTDAQGRITLEGLDAGVYSVQELNAPEGYVLNSTEHHVKLYPGETSTIVIENEKRPALRIVKYDAQTKKPLPDTTFEVYRDAELVGTYTTDANGEILLYDLEPGTYLVKEVSAPDSHVLNSTPQEIELEAGQTGTLVFLNYLKPGIYLVKLDSRTLEPLANARFRVTQVGGGYSEEHITDINGEIDLSGLDPGSYTVEELAAPDGYLIDDAQRIIKIEGGEYAQFVFTNTRKPTFRLVKLDSLTSKRLPGATFRIAKIEDGTHYLDRVTDMNGEIVIDGLEPGVYSVVEMTAPEGYVRNPLEYHVELVPGRQAELVVSNAQRPSLVIVKRDADTGEPVPGTVFEVRAADGHSVDEVKTDKDGRATVENLLPGVYEVTEKSVPAPYLLDAESQLVTLYPNRCHSVYFEDHKRPSLTVNKIDSVTGSPIEGAKFEVRYGSAGDLNDLGTFYTDENGQFSVDDLKEGWYRVTELEPAAGYVMKEPSTQEFYLKGGESKTVTFENTPKNAIIVEKYDSVTGEPIPGCTFQLRYLGGTSGTGGTVIGAKVTGKNGVAVWTNLDPGTYIVEEVDPAEGYNILQSSETVFLADNGKQSVVTVRFLNAPDGMLLIRKVCSVNPSVTLPGAEFKITYADGTLIGDSNGLFTTDEKGEIRVTGLKPGKSVIVTETRAPAGFIIDSQSQTVQIKEGRVVSLTFRNQPKGAIVVKKVDSATGKPLSGAEFRITTSAGCEVGLNGVIGTSTLTQNGIFTTDSNGEIKVSNLAPGTYVLTEIKAPDGYVMDSVSTNVVIGSGGDTQVVTVKNSKAGTLIVDKRDSRTGKPLEGVQFKITTASGEFVPDENGRISSNGIYFTNKDGQIVLHGVVGTLVVTETVALPGYTMDDRPQTVVVNPNDTQTLYFTNTPSTTLVIEKYIEGTTTPLKGVTFLVTDSSGAVVGKSNGEYITDENGRIVIEDLTPGTTVVAKEVKTVDGFVLDSTPKSILIKAGEVQTLRFYNKQTGTLIVQKKDKQTGEPLAGVEFEITYSDGRYVDADYGHTSSKGLYKTDANGEIRIPGVVGTVVVTETKPLEGYVMDEGTRSQTVVVNPGDTQTIVVYNTKMSGLTIVKKDADTGERIKGVQFEVRKANGEIVGHYTTDTYGTVYLPNMPSGWYEVIELSPAKGYVLDDTPHRVEVKDGGAALLEITNRRIAGITIHKVDSATGKGIYGVVFMVYDNNKKPVEQIVTDQNGYAYTDTALDAGRYYVRELEAAEGYLEDKEYKTIFVETGENVIVEWENTAVTGQIQITKTSADYNPNNGWAAGTPIPGTEFEVYDRVGNLVDTVRTDKNGVAKTRPLPLGRYTIIESKAASFYALDKTPIEVEIEFSGQIVRAAMTNKSLIASVSLEKHGYNEVIPVQRVRYDFSGIANNSTTALESFYFRDTLPTGAVRLSKIVTGTWSAQGTYKIVYKTNLSQEYRLLADSLSTSQNRTLDASETALGLTNGEYVTEVMFVFGIVPAGFRQVDAPMIYCTVLPTLTGGTKFTNVADVGGIFNGQWVMAVDRWVTTVYRPADPTPLPRTGY